MRLARDVLNKGCVIKPVTTVDKQSQSTCGPGSKSSLRVFPIEMQERWGIYSPIPESLVKGCLSMALLAC